MIDAAVLWAQTEQWRTALMQRRLTAANDNDPPDPPPALSLQLPHVERVTIRAFGIAA